MKKLTLLLVIATLLTLGGCTQKNALDDKFFTPDTENQNIGETKTIIDDGDNLVKVISYPTLGNKDIDADIYNVAVKVGEELSEKFADYKAKGDDKRAWCFVDFNTHVLGENLVSVIFRSHYTSPGKESETGIKSMVYNLSTGKKVESEELFKGDYLKLLEKKSREFLQKHSKYGDFANGSVYESGTAAKIGNYQNIVFAKDNFEIILPKYTVLPGSFGDLFVKIPYSEVQDILSFDHTAQVIVPVKEVPPAAEAPKVPTQTGKKMVALTFDDGPYAKVTGKILDILKENNNSRATFFMLGNRVATYPETVARIEAEGSELGNHSFDHKQLTKLTPDEIKKQLDDTNTEVEKVAGKKPILHRPTYGATNDKLKENANMPLILWNIDTQDWKSKNAEKVAEEALKNVSDGDIILMHDIYVSTGEACEVIIPKLIEKGFELVTVSELMAAKGITLSNGEKYTSGHVKK